MRYRVMLLGLAVPALLLAQQPEQLPRFRAGANLVRVDAYVSKDNVALTDLKAEDFDGLRRRQAANRSRASQLIQARASQSADRAHRSRPTCATCISRRRTPRACSRCFSIKWSRVSCRARIARASRSSTRWTSVIGPDDLVGVMTPEMSPGVDHLQPPHRQHRARRHRHLVLGQRKNTPADDAARRLDSRLLSDGRDARSRRQDDRAAARAADARRARRRSSRISRRCVPSASS